VSSRHHDRIRRLVAWARQHSDWNRPLFLLHSPALPSSPPAEVEAARAAGRRIFHVHFVGPEGDPRVINRAGAPVLDRQ
jgi:hypothetical protein